MTHRKQIWEVLWDLLWWDCELDHHQKKGCLYNFSIVSSNGMLVKRLSASKQVMKASHETVSIEMKVFILIAYVESNFD